jgi:hypothetical protein
MDCSWDFKFGSCRLELGIGIKPKSRFLISFVRRVELSTGDSGSTLFSFLDTSPSLFRLESASLVSMFIVF